MIVTSKLANCIVKDFNVYSDFYIVHEKFRQKYLCIDRAMTLANILEFIRLLFVNATIFQQKLDNIQIIGNARNICFIRII